MKTTIILTLLTLSFTFPTNSQAQKYNSPVEYLEALQVHYSQLTKDMWDYSKAVARDKSARKIENKRRELITTVKNNKSAVIRAGGYDGDKSLKDTLVSYFDIYYHVLNDNYGEIMDLEEIAEKSYDAMEALINVREEANTQLQRANEMVNVAEKKFAEEHGITLVENTTKIGQKLKRANEAFDYYDDIFLIYFKCQVTRNNLVDAMNQGDMNAAEQNKESLISYAQEGRTSLKKLPSYKGDGTLKLEAMRMMDYFEKQVAGHANATVDFNLKKENMEKLQQVIENTKKKDLTQEQVDEYNEAIGEYQKAVEEYNKMNQESNKASQKNGDAWNKAVADFLGRHAG